MNVQFRRADKITELRSLMLFDRKVFGADAFDRDMWSDMDVWWMLVNGVKAGCTAFEPNEPEKGTLYIATTGILPRLQGQGLGRLMKAWQLAWARRNGFSRIVTNHRASNKSMIRLNKLFGFKKVARIPDYYENPREAAISMELRLKL